ncbi:glycosyltransferase family 4 protein [Methylobacterium sp. J-026]|uniref:glycosyltransferase family 4 protein n=1 Tax=Methylobacterium sp. J-026 TaxID=2836624 RepID=UPI001FBB266B|nr:glycosyltransferase family 4 protein [Methylobacterium sp. J-026]MCJ2138167.1 glycosyltransferase family 4 protein [Methylobacterium sp. J-026]
MVGKSNDDRIVQRYRILHVFRAPVGGLFRHVVDLARLQAAAGHAVGIVCDSTTGGERGERALADLMPSLELGLVRIPMRRNPHRSDWTCLKAVGRRAAAVGAEVLHGHGAKGGAFARLAPGSTAIRTYTPHGGSYNYRPGTPIHRLYMGAEAVLARRTDAFLFESEYVAGRHRTFVGGPERVTRIVHNGIAEAEFAPIDRVDEPFDLLYVGELREAKGLPYLLDALVHLRTEGRSLRLLMVGSGPDADILRQNVERLGLGSAVSFEPPQAIRTVLARGRILVVPSLAESLPYVVLEAAAAAQPLVATRVGGIPEIFGDAAGDLVPPRDPASLAAGIRRVLDDAPAVLDARVNALSAAIRQRFSLERMGSEVISGYAAAFQARADRHNVEAREIAGARTA